MDYWELLEEQHDHDVILSRSRIDAECEADYCEIEDNGENSDD